jgi:hypothetical protein
MNQMYKIFFLIHLNQMYQEEYFDARIRAALEQLFLQLGLRVELTFDRTPPPGAHAFGAAPRDAAANAFCCDSPDSAQPQCSVCALMAADLQNTARPSVTSPVLGKHGACVGVISDAVPIKDKNGVVARRVNIERGRVVWSAIWGSSRTHHAWAKLHLNENRMRPKEGYYRGKFFLPDKERTTVEQVRTRMRLADSDPHVARSPNLALVLFCRSSPHSLTTTTRTRRRSSW